MRFAQIVLPAILFAVCRAQSYGGDEYGGGGAAGATTSFDGSAATDALGSQWFRHLEQQQKREQLVGQYRFMIAKSLLRLKDACKVYDLFVMNAEPQATFGQTERMPGDGESRRLTILND